MTTQSARQPAALELALIDVVRTLPSRRVLQVLDFARWLQTQLTSDEDHAAMEQDDTSACCADMRLIQTETTTN
jgi:hypothetical protein